MSHYPDTALMFQGSSCSHVLFCEIKSSKVTLTIHMKTTTHVKLSKKCRISNTGHKYLLLTAVCMSIHWWFEKRGMSSTNLTPA